MSIFFLIFVGLTGWRALHSPNFYTITKGHIKSAEVLIGPPIVKGGAGVTLNVIYEYEFKNITYVNKRRVGCDQYEITSSNIQKLEEVAHLKNLAHQLQKLNYLNVMIRIDAPDISCIIKNNQIIK